MKNLMKLNKRGIGALNMLVQGAITILIAVITVSIAISVNENIKDSFTANSSAWNASAKGTTGLAAFSDYWVSIVSIIILVVIVGLFSYFRGAGGGTR